MPSLIDVTAERFKIVANAEVIDFIRRHNPFAHSDVAAKLLLLSKRLSGAGRYCPSFAACAYVVLHTDRNVIFAVAHGMHLIDFHLPRAAVVAALTGGRGDASAIGEEWLSIDAFARERPRSVREEQLLRFAQMAKAYAETLPPLGK